MIVEDRIAAFLRTNSKQPYCDDCLGRLLKLGTAGNTYGEERDGGTWSFRDVYSSVWNLFKMR